MTHPARFSKEIIDVMVEILQGYQSVTPIQHLHDPFAGTGERLWELAGRLEPRPWITGTEIEPEFIVNPWIRVGDATDPTTYPTPPYVIITSPSYPNGIADHWEAKDDSRRNTYRAALKTILGYDRSLSINNLGRYGYRGTGSLSSKRAKYWQLADRCICNWSGATMVLLNVSDFMWSKGGFDHIEPVVASWRAIMEKHGWEAKSVVPVGTPRLRYGTGSDKRVEVEKILVMSR